MPVFINETLKRILDMDVLKLEKKFDQVKEKLLQDYNNSYLDQSYLQSMNLFKSAIIDVEFQKKELRECLEKYSFKDFDKDAAKWLVTGK